MLEFNKIGLDYDHKPILQDISLSVPRGECLVLLGPSGSGKSSLLRVAAGLERPARGQVVLNGRVVSSPGSMEPCRLRKMSMVFQSLALWPHMTAAQHIEFVVGRKNRGRAGELLGGMRLGGKEQRYPAQLSGGEKQRLAIARALASEPEYLLMDEPFSSLDYLLKEEMLELALEQIRVRNMGAIFVTHNLEEALYAADSLAVMIGGQVRKRWKKGINIQITRQGILDCFSESGHGK